ncbi:MAG: pyridoxamine 5'-phosphate oxidase family protein [Haloarculaceae archaeon]
MGLDEQTAMSEDAVDDLLARREAAVLSLAHEGMPYSIPISYGYDVDERTFFLRLVSTPESDKRGFLDSSQTCRLVIYEEADPIYRSVVATGDLKGVDPADLLPGDIAQYGNAQRPLFEVWSESKADLDIDLFVMDPEDISGRRVDVRADDD